MINQRVKGFWQRTLRGFEAIYALGTSSVALGNCPEVVCHLP